MRQVVAGSEAFLAATERDPVPEGAVVEWFTAADGARIRVARWRPPGALRGTVVILNGRTEFIEKYFEVTRDLLRRRFAVATLDWRGQGLSTRLLRNPNKGHVAGFGDYVSDLRGVLERFVEPHCPRPLTAMAHSMGGCIALQYLAQHPGSFASAIFSAPMWGIGRSVRPASWVRTAAAGLCMLGAGERYLPGTGDYGESSRRFEANGLTQDSERFARFVAQVAAEPRLAIGGATIGWLRQAIAAIDALHVPGFAERLDIPIRVCTALEDRIVSVAAQTRISERLPNAEQVVVEGAWHELMMERDEFRHHYWSTFDDLISLGSGSLLGARPG